MKDKSIDDLVLKSFQGKADEKDYETIRKWLKSDRSNLEYYREIRDSWIAAGIATNQNEYNCEKAWRRISRRTGIKWFGAPWIQSGWEKIAAVIIFAFVLGGLGYYYYYHSQNDFFIEREYIVKTPPGSRTFLVLPDSTSVWLNAGSTLRYPADYNITERSVHLTGEAYFIVESVSNLPFRVYADDIVINALGTEFNVKAYPGEDQVETTLVSGLVTLEWETPDGEVEEILLEPGHKAYFTVGDPITDLIDIPEIIEGEVDGIIKESNDRSSTPDQSSDRFIVREDVNTEVYTSWKDNRLIFERKKMVDVAVILERMYDVDITFKDAYLKGYHLSGSLELKTFEQLLEAIRLTIPLDYSIDNRDVFLKLDRESRDRYDKLNN